MRILVVNGPNLNMLGKRELALYGELTLEEINAIIVSKANEYGLNVDFFQSNFEGEIIEKLHSINSAYAAIIINPAALGHYSISLLDAIKMINIPIIEVHMTNIYAREEFRKVSVIAPVVTGQITGFGYNSYIAALCILNNILSK